MKEKLDAAQRLIKAKRLLITRLQREIVNVRECADADVSHLQNRIFVAKTLLAALENGAIKAAHLGRK